MCIDSVQIGGNSIVCYLVLVDGIYLVTQLGHAVVVLLAKCGKGSLVGNVGFVQIHFELGQLGL